MESPLVYGVDYDVLMQLTAKEILKMCQVSHQFDAICQDDYFWKIKLEHDYPHLINLKPTSTWKSVYLDIEQEKLKPFPVYHNNKLLDYIWLRPNDSHYYVLLLIYQFIVDFYNDYYLSDIFIHVLLDNTHYVPVLLSNLHKDMTTYMPEYQGRLWDVKGFEMIDGQIVLFHDVDEPYRYYKIILPNGKEIRGIYPH